MSFTSDVKKELTGLEAGKKCCQLAQISGYLRFAGSIKIMGGKMAVKVATDNPAVARLFITMCRDYFGAKAALNVAEPSPLSKKHTYEMLITPEMNADAILRETGMLTVKEGSNIITDGLDPQIIKKRCCKKAMLRGIFMAAGSVNDPASGYHLEINCLSEYMAKDLQKLIGSFGLKPGISMRRGKYVVYIKDGEQIEDFLSILGVSSMLFRYQDVRITREMRNKANRINNCESANTDKAVSASIRHREAIEYISRHGGLDRLPVKLRQTAELRMSNPELSLSELGELLDPPLKKSGINHRLEKICEFSQKIRKESAVCEKDS